MTGVRLDKWLQVARMFKTRTKATHACELGRVCINGSPAKAHRNLAQFGGIPAARFDLLFEKPLHFFGVRRGAAILEHAANVRGDVAGSEFAFGHTSRWQVRHLAYPAVRAVIIKQVRIRTL